MAIASSISTRRTRAVESFRNAAECIGPIQKGISLFAITRGQFSMIDAVLHVLDCVGPAKLSLWTWTVAEYEVQCLERLKSDFRVTAGKLIIDAGARNKNASIISQWQETFGGESVRYVVNHSKMATVEGGGLKVLLRGSMNLNFNPRFEQLDVTEGGEDFELVRRIEDELPLLPDNVSNGKARVASRVSEAFDPEQLKMFSGIKVWGK